MLSPGSVFAGYRVEGLLGVGGMGEVYRVAHPRLPRREALKVLPADVSADQEYRQRFIREADLAASLWHPHIVGVHDRGEFDAQLWISMDYVEGTDLGAQLRQRYPAGMPATDVATIITAVAEALDYAHTRGLMHRDVKPANIMITTPTDGSSPRVLLTDFGIARNLNDISGLTMTNMTVGTVAYSAPEQLRGDDINGRADQYALAATAYHLLTGTKLFEHSNPVAVISAHLSSPPPLPGQTRPDLAALDPTFARALSKNPEQRFPLCADFAAALSTHITNTTTDHTTAAPTHHAPTTQHWPTPPPTSDVGDQHRQPASALVGYSPAALPHPPVASQQVPATRGQRPLWGRFRGRTIALSAAGLAVVTTATLIGVMTASGGDGDTAAPASTAESARSAAEHYLKALAAGDAKTALSLSASPPPDTGMLTDEVLRAQLAVTPITDVSVTAAPPGPGDDPQQVQFVVLKARFGDQPSQTRIAVRRNGDEWKLQTTAVTLSLSSDSSNTALLGAVSVWNVPVKSATKVALFPGAVEVSSSNPNIAISAATKPLLLDALTSTADPTLRLEATLTDVGRKAVYDAVDAWGRYCYHGQSPPPDCRKIISSSANVVPDSTAVAGNGDFGDVTTKFDPQGLKVAVSGIVRWPAHATVTYGAADYAFTVPIGGTVDLSNNPAIFTPNPS
ncbi:Serine/threonine protein kinase [uncultured Mycobacterium sp.]|uniref:non-specific serine/threonine protein kinase n=1 Tax=uncultured Mycobacterium sp. TaxID=171292 RepID=A0A1Y5PJA4_9MYCO|nr:Serine/threonine protein kinase [uncultured Mycobacterium sp.]